MKFRWNSEEELKVPIPKQRRHFYSFDAFRLGLAQRELFRAGELVLLTPKAFDALSVIVSHHGHIVDKDEFLRTLWPDTFVEEDSLVQQISHLRKVLGERPDGGPYIETVSRRGYRFAAPVTESWEEHPAEPPVAVRLRSRRLLWPALAAATVIVLAAAGVFVWQRMQAKPFTERDWIVLADFTNTTGDPVFDGTLKQALSASLSQSPYLNVFPEERVAETLRLMERPTEERVMGRLARELCVRAGVKALLAGSIAAVGSHYSIGLDAMNCSTGDTLAQEHVEAENKDRVLGALGQAASRMRRKLGESLASIEKMDVPIREATTSSLEALKAYSLGRRQHSSGRMLAARPFYLRAIELDPNFASAFEWLAFTYRNLGEVLASREFFTRAFELRQRVSERERLFFEASYYASVVMGPGESPRGLRRLDADVPP